MRVGDLVCFSKENYFNGAVQTEWIYDHEKVERVSTSYVFHGPQYFGVSAKDFSVGNHSLIDTASFTKRIVEKVYSKDTKENQFVMTIAGYGTGKSHLAVSIGALLSGNERLVNGVTKNIIKAVQEIGEYIKQVNDKANLIIALNGMNNFNLDAEVLKCARLSLASNNIDEKVLHSITKTYEIVRHFVDKNFFTYCKSFESRSETLGIGLRGEDLKKYLLQHVEDDNSVLVVVNEIYKEATGDTIRWERGLSAGDVLSVLQKELCGPQGPFNKLVILFDEFGRYIEYAAANPAIAGDAALQQVFEAVQSADGKILFVGFIQSELSAYLSRIEKTSNIVRYIGRYENSEKFFLSSNFETILANLLKKKEEAGFSRVVDNAVSRYEKYYTKVFETINRWDKSAKKKSVWTSARLYNSVIQKGCYPLHPITTWLLSNTSQWMQQRSTITFVAEMFECINDSEISGSWLPYLYPIDIVDSSIFSEMLNSEEKGLVSSQYCMLYRDIVVKIGNKLTDNELKVLKSVLLMNVGKFSLRDKEDAMIAIRYCSNLREEDIAPAVKSLEDMHGVISFDENSKTFDLIAEANGFNEFKRVYVKYRLGTEVTIDDLDSNLLNEALLSGCVETSFAQEHNVSSSEWVFEKSLIPSERVDEPYIKTILREIEDENSGEEPRGRLLYVYCAGDDSEISRLSSLYRAMDLSKYPIILLFLDDTEKSVLESLKVIKSLHKFSQADRERFQKHIDAQVRSHSKKIIQNLHRLVSGRVIVGEHGLQEYTCRLNALCTNKFNELFTKTPPFLFDGFQNKTTAQAKKYLSNICIKLFDRTLMNVLSYQALTPDEKNRIKACLSINVPTSWQVFGNDCVLLVPKQPIIREIYDALICEIDEKSPKAIGTLLGKYLHAPYGMNLNSLALFLFYFIAERGNALYCYYGTEKLNASHLSGKIFKAGKLQAQELKRIRLQLNSSSEVDRLAEECKKALSCKDVDECKELKKRIEEITRQEGVSAENQTILAQATFRLDEGIKLSKIIQENIQKAKMTIIDAKKQLLPLRFIKVFECLVDCSKPLSEEYGFICSDKLKKQTQELNSEVCLILQKQYPIAIENVRCDITQLSQIKQAYKRVIETLEQNNYIEYAELTQNRLIELEEELVAKQKYEKIFAEINRDIQMCSDVSAFSYGTTTEMLTKISNWSAYIENAKDLPDSILKQAKLGLLDCDWRLKIRKDELMSKIDDVDSRERNAKSRNDLTECLELIKNLKTLQFDESSEQALLECKKRVEERLAILDTIPESLDNLYEMQKNVSNMDFVVASEIRKRIKDGEESQKEWLQTYISPYESSLDEMTASDCTDWIRRAESVPERYSNEVKKRHAAIKNRIMNQLHKCRVDGVISMYLSLTQDEKKQCMEILNNL